MKYVLDKLYCDVGHTQTTLKNLIARRLGLQEKTFRFEIVDREYVLDGQTRGILYKVNIETVEFIRDTSIHFLPDLKSFEVPPYPHKDNPIVVGAGLAGLFSAYTLALSGARPIILEAGNEKSSSRYGLGGYLALTGCVVRREKDDLLFRWLLSTLTKMGVNIGDEHNTFVPAPMVYAFAVAMKKEIEARGGRFIFNATYTGHRSLLGKIKEVKYIRNGKEIGLASSHVLLCAGENSPALLSVSGVGEAKPYLQNVSFYLEKPLSELNQLIYGSPFQNSKIPSYYYQHHHKGSDGEFTVVNFYPHATPINLSLAEKGIEMGVRMADARSTSGLTSLDLYLGDKLSVNDALVFAGTAYKESLPSAFPCEALKDFLAAKEPMRIGFIRPSYSGGVYLADFNQAFGPIIASSLRKALAWLEKKNGFFSDGRALLLGPGFTFGNGEKYLLDEEGKTKVKGLYLAAPTLNSTYIGTYPALAGIKAALGLIKGK